MIVLVPMRDADYTAYIVQSVADFAADKVASGQWSNEESLPLARAGFAELLPRGLQTPRQHLFKTGDAVTGAAVGVLWFAVQSQAGADVAYVYDIRIEPQARRKGYARATFAAVEKLGRERGLAGTALHVFGHNIAARALYESLGFRSTNISMFKKMPT